MSFRTKLAASFCFGLVAGGLLAGSSCDVYDSSLLLEQHGISVQDGGSSSGIGWWSKTDKESHCSSASMPTPDDRPGKSGNSESLSPIIMAMTNLRLGSRTPEGTISETAWQDIGLDLDNTCTRSPTCDSTELFLSCKPAHSLLPTDGNYCRDNMFGKFEYLIESNKDISEKFGLDEGNFNCSICRGAFNMVVRVSNYNGKPNDDSVRLDIFPSPGIETLHEVDCHQFKGDDESKCWTQSDAWYAQEKFVAEKGGSGIPTRSKLSDPAAYVREGYLIASLPSNTEMWFPGYRGTAVAFPVVLQRGLVVGKLSKTKDGQWRITDGVIGGAMKVEDTVESFRAIGMCAGDPLNDTVRGYSANWADLLSTGAKLPDTKCDSLSVGIGFEARSAKLGPPQPVVRKDLCADAGVDANPADTGTDATSVDGGAPDGN